MVVVGTLGTPEVVVSASLTLCLGKKAFIVKASRVGITVVRPPKNPTCCGDISFQKNTRTKISAKNKTSNAKASPTWARTHNTSKGLLCIVGRLSTLQFDRSIIDPREPNTGLLSPDYWWCILSRLLPNRSR